VTELPQKDAVRNVRRYVSPIAGFAAGKAIPGVLTLISIPIWIREFGPANYAAFSLYWTISLVGTTFTTGWLNQAILRYAGDRALAYENLSCRIRTALEATPLVTIVPLIALVGFMVPDGAGRWAFLSIASVGLLANARYQVRQTLAQRDARANVFAIAETIRAGCALVFSLLLAAAHVTAPWSLVAAYTAAIILATTVLRRPAGDDAAPTMTDGAVVRDYWRFGWPLSLWLPLSLSTIYLDRFVINALYGLDRAGTYAAAADLVVRGMGLMVTPVILFMHPAIMRAWNTEDRARAIRTWRWMTLLLTFGVVAAAVLILVAYALFADLVLAQVLPIAAFAALTIGGAAWQLALMVHKPLEATNRTGTMLGALVVSLLVTGTLDLILAPRLAELGVAVAFAAGAGVYITLVLAFDAQVFRAQRRQAALP
jgi:O-antigen/teichoic acid export membrane protein